MPHVVLPRIPRAVALLGVLAAGRAAAQTPAEPPTECPCRPSAPAPRSGEPGNAWVFSLGTDVRAADNVLGRFTPGLATQLGYERRLGPAGSPFSLRVAGEYWSSRSTFAPFRGAGAPYDLTYTRRTKIVGGSVFGIYRLPLALGPVRPYALAGVGMYQYGGTNEARTPEGGNVVYQPGDHENSVAYTGGLGATVRLGHVDLFGEARLTNLPALTQVRKYRSRVALGARLPF